MCPFTFFYTYPYSTSYRLYMRFTIHIYIGNIPLFIPILLATSKTIHVVV